MVVIRNSGVLGLVLTHVVGRSRERLLVHGLTTPLSVYRWTRGPKGDAVRTKDVSPTSEVFSVDYREFGSVCTDDGETVESGL